MTAPFPGTRADLPFGSFALIWAFPEEHRREVAWIELGGEGTLAARGRQVCTGEEPYLLEYELETGPRYVTERLHAAIAGGPELMLQRGRSPELEGVLDCDLGFSPLTNAMPVLRDRLHEGGDARAVDVAWVSVPDLTVHRDRQIYEPLAAGRLRFCSPEAGFERIIDLTPAGFVRDYPDIARLVGTVHRPSHAEPMHEPVA